MQIRLVPVDAVFLRFPRVVRDVAARLGKQVDLQLIGNETELDRAIVDAIGDPLVHLVRNSLDHGLETPEERLAAGKPAAGTLTLAARHSGGSIVITVTDDGRGVDPARVARVAAERGLIDPARVTDVGVEDAIELLFAPGFSTADEVGDLSGRGVGLDAVRARLRELGGEITVLSVPGVGTESEIRLPLTLAVVSALLVEVGGRPFGIPVQQVERTLPVAGAAIRSAGPGRILACDGQELPLVSASVLLGGAGGGPEEQIVVVRGATGSVALCVARIVGEVELVTRPLPAGTVATGAVTGAAALSSGGLVLIADGDALAAAADDGPAQELAA